MSYEKQGRGFVFPDVSRRTGRTTRLADKLIQELFIEGSTTIIDHATTPNNMADSHLLDVVWRRLMSEHGGKEYFKLDRNKRTISINDNV